MKRLGFLFAILVFCSQIALHAQGLQVTGIVTSSEDDSPLPGVSVSVQGSGAGTVTTIDGEYTIKVPDNESVLVFSFVGMETQEITVGGQSQINVVLESDKVKLAEVVVTAMGITREAKSLGYSVSEVGSEELEKSQNLDLSQALTAKVAGVSVVSSSGAPGASTRVIIRGISSLTGSNQPLYVIDGVPIYNITSNNSSTLPRATANRTMDFGNAISDLNPNDIESMSILKGASATSLYGSRAANGAVIITTKSGKKNQGMKIDFNTSAAISDVGRLPYYQDVFGQGWSGHFDKIENGSWGPVMDGEERLTGNTVDNSRRLMPFKFQENGMRDFYEYGYSLDNSLSITGGTEMLAYKLAYANSTADGVVPYDSDMLKRNALNFKLDAEHNKTRISFGVNYTNKIINAVATGQGDDAGGGKALYQELLQNPVNHYVPLYRDYQSKFDNLDNYYTPYAQNPYWIVNENGNDFKQNRMISNLSISRSLIEGLNIKWNGGLDHLTNFYRDYGAVARITPGAPNSTANDVEGTTKDEERSYTQINSDLLLNYSHGFQDFNLNVMLGNNINQRASDRRTTIANGLVVPEYYNVQNISGSAAVSSFESLRRLVGVYGEIGVDYKEMLYLQVSARNDWSSTLPQGNNSFFYPGVNLSFVFSEIADIPTLSFGKLRAGYAVSGMDADVYRVESYYRAANIRGQGFAILQYPIAGVPAYEKHPRLGNPELQPEISNEMEVGLELSLLNDRVGVDLAYYDKVTTGLILDANIDPSSGYSLITTNLGQISNTGIELMLNLVPVKTNSFEWSLQYIFTKANTIMDKLDEDLGVEEYLINSAYQTEYVAIPGEQLGMFRIPDYKYAPDGSVIVGTNGLPLEGDKRLIGSSVPDYNMSLRNTISYKNLSLYALVDLQKGGNMYSYTSSITYWSGNNEQSITNLRRPWVIPNSVQEVVADDGTVSYVENNVPVHNNWHEYYSQNTNRPIAEERNITKTYFKVREVSLSYNISNAFLERAKISNLRLSLYGRNLLLWTPADNSFIDPDNSTWGNDLEGMMGEFGGAPQVRTYGMKLGLSF